MQQNIIQGSGLGADLQGLSTTKKKNQNSVELQEGKVLFADAMQSLWQSLAAGGTTESQSSKDKKGEEQPFAQAVKQITGKGGTSQVATDEEDEEQTQSVFAKYAALDKERSDFTLLSRGTPVSEMKVLEPQAPSEDMSILEKIADPLISSLKFAAAIVKFL